MIKHSVIIEDFLDDPKALRDSLLAANMVDYRASDDVVYPGIVIDIPAHVKFEALEKIQAIYNREISSSDIFARFSFDTMSPPNWAHSDLEMAQVVGLLYLNPEPPPFDGTHLVRHRSLNFEQHPVNDVQLRTLLKEGNDRTKWDVTYTCPARYNRMFFINARYLHAASCKYGISQQDARLVMTVFFNLK